MPLMVRTPPHTPMLVECVQDFRTVFSRTQVLGAELDDALKRATLAEEESRDSRQELIRQVGDGVLAGSRVAGTLLVC